MTEEDRIDFVTGQVHALKAVMLALIEVYPQPAHLRRILESCDQVSQARSEADFVSESFLEGRKEVFETLNAFAAKMVELRAKKI